MIVFRILGPFEVMDGDRPLLVGGPKERALLSLLVLDTGQVVSVDRLVDGMWGENAPATAVGTIRTYVSHLRRALGTTGEVDLIETVGAGYRLRAEPHQIDAYRFSQLVEQGSRAYEEGSYGEASEVLGDALTMWRGPPFIGLTDHDQARV